MGSIFISYSRTDEDFVTRLVADLERQEKTVFYDRRLRPGESWVKALAAVIERAQYILLVLSPDYLKGGWAVNELEAVLERRARREAVVIPVLFRDCDIPPALREITWTDFRENYDAGLQDLFRALAERDVEEPVPPAEPAEPVASKNIGDVLRAELQALRADMKTEFEGIRQQIQLLSNNILSLQSAATSESSAGEQLPDFLQVFHKAKWMLEHSDQRFWMLNYTPVFGHIHTYDKKQLTRFWLGKRKNEPIDYEDAQGGFFGEVTEFVQRLSAKAGSMKSFKLATTHPRNLPEQFLTPIEQKAYEDFYNPGGDTRSMIENIESLHTAMVKGIQTACETREKTSRILGGHSGGTAQESTACLTFMERIQSQIFIADAKEADTLSCLVFFIGDHNIGVERRVNGFYTEDPLLVRLFEGIFYSNVYHFAKRDA